MNLVEPANKIVPDKPAELRPFRELVGGAIDAIVGRNLPEAEELAWKASLGPST